MPFLKKLRAKMSPVKQADQLAQKSGQRHTVYSVNLDEYTGEWFDNKKHGKGTFLWKASGAIYDGDWRKDRRHGYGTYSVPRPNGGWQKQYAGGWKGNKRHGYGTHFYSDDEYYEGEWYADKRSGWGRMYSANGNIYEGEWYDDQRSGQGMIRLANENRYEGNWKNDKKNGEGKFYYLDKGQIFEGVWCEDIPKAGEMRDFDRDTAPDATQFPIPKIELADPVGILADTLKQYLQEQD